MHILLASASPRRQAILQQLGIQFQVVAPQIEEDISDLPPLEAPRLLAVEKAMAISRTYPEHLVLGYDTLVFLDGSPLGKPVDRAEAYRMLEGLRDRWHEVRTGFCLAQGGQVREEGVECTRVRFRAFSKQELDDYIADGEPFDKAGAYGIQGKGARFVRAIEGCYYNVVGLPVTKTLEALLAHAENME